MAGACVLRDLCNKPLSECFSAMPTRGVAPAWAAEPGVISPRPGQLSHLCRAFRGFDELPIGSHKPATTRRYTSQ